MKNNAELGKYLIEISSTYDRLSLNRLRCDAASEMLGVKLAPDGNYTKIVAELNDELYTSLYVNLGFSLSRNMFDIL